MNLMVNLDEFKEEGNVLFFKNIKGNKFQAISNLFGDLERSRFIFRDSLSIIKDLIEWLKFKTY